MDPRRKLRIKKIFVNLNNEGYDVYDCEVNQTDGSLEVQENCESIESLEPISPLPSFSQNSISPHATQITCQADVHAPYDYTFLKPAVYNTSQSTEVQNINVKTTSFIKPRHVILHSNKSMTISNDCLDLIKISTPTHTERPSENDYNSENTSVFTGTTQITLPEKENAHSLSSITVMPVSAGFKEIEYIRSPDKFENESENNRSSPSLLEISTIHTTSNKRSIENRIEIEKVDEPNVEEPYLDDITKRKRSKKIDKNNWKRSTAKQLREKGMQYYGKKKEEDSWVYDKIKKEKTLKPRCNCKLSSLQSKFKCLSITEEKRNTIFKNFWSSMSWKEKKMYVKTLIIVKPTERKRTEKENSRRKHTLELYLEVDSVKIRVCKTMFLNTLDIGEWMLLNWTKQDIENETTKNYTETETETRQQHEQLKKEEKVKQFFNCLPKLESHYCRSQSSKLYLEPIWERKTQLLQEYNNVFAKENGYDLVSITTLSKVFKDMNLSLFRPKKDLCDICEAHKCKNVSEEQYSHHIKMKNAARAEKEADKKSDKEVLTMDLQSVLLCPKSNASALYYKTKLIVHNFTVYDIKRSEGYCFFWNETEGSLTANDFSSVIIRMLELFIQKHNLTEGVEIILFSDGCTYQNRNVTLSNALLNFSVLKKIKIVQKILEKGHTQMEADSMHSVIERQVRNKKINVPADYVNIAKTACNKKPYHVEYLEHTFFKQFDNLRTYKTIRPGKKAGDPVVTDLRQLTYLPEGKILYRLGFTEEHEENPLPMRAKLTEPVSMQDLPRLYSERLKIKKSKFEHLQQLKMVMEADYHPFYDAIPYE